jgi:hypothetical protein
MMSPEIVLPVFSCVARRAIANRRGRIKSTSACEPFARNAICSMLNV